MKRAALLVLTVSGTACGEPDCWFDLHHVAATGELYVVRDCGSEDHGLFRAEPATGAYDELGRGRWLTRVVTDAAGEQIFATGAANRRISRYDRSGARIARGPSWFGEVGQLRVTPDGEALWAAFWGTGGAVAVFETRGMQIRAGVDVPGNPVAIDLDPTGRRVVAVPSQVGEAQWIDGPSFTPTPSFETTGALDVVTIGDDTVAVLEDRERRIVLHDLTGETPRRTLETGVGPRRLAVTEDGTTLLVTERDADLVRVFDLPTATETATFAVPGGPEAIVVAGAKAYVGLRRGGAVAGIDLETGEETERYE